MKLCYNLGPAKSVNRRPPLIWLLRLVIFPFPFWQILRTKKSGISSPCRLKIATPDDDFQSTNWRILTVDIVVKEVLKLGLSCRWGLLTELSSSTIWPIHFRRIALGLTSFLFSSEVQPYNCLFHLCLNSSAAGNFFRHLQSPEK